MNNSTRMGFGIRSFGLSTLVLMVLTLPLMNVAVAVNLGDCQSGSFIAESPVECTGKVFCIASGCVGATDYGANSCKAGFAIVTLQIAAADRIKTGTCSQSTNNACSKCSGSIICAKGDAFGGANCTNSCNKVEYRYAGGAGRCI